MKFMGILLLCAASVAAEPETRPKPMAPTTPAVPISRPALIDPRQPTFVPKFAQPNPTPAGPSAERDYAMRYTDPAPGYIGYGWGYGGHGYGWHGFGRGSWGSTQIQFR